MSEDLPETMSEDMPGRICQKICRKECQKICQKDPPENFLYKMGCLKALTCMSFCSERLFFAFLCTSKLIRNNFCEISANSRRIHFVDNPPSAVAIWSQVLDSGHASGSRRMSAGRSYDLRCWAVRGGSARAAMVPSKRYVANLVSIFFSFFQHWFCGGGGQVGPTNRKALQQLQNIHLAWH